MVEETEEPGLIEQVKGLINYSPESEKHLSNELWLPDRGDGDFTLTAVDAGDATENLNYNRGLIIRRNKFKTPGGDFNKQCTVLIPLRKLFPYFDFTRNLLKGIDHKFKLHVNDKNKMIFRSGGAAVGKVIYNYLCMWLPKVKPSNKWEMTLNDQMVKGMTKSIGWNKWTYYLRDDRMALGTRNIKWDIPTSETRPKRLYLIIQRSDALSDQEVNTMTFGTSIQTVYKIQWFDNPRIHI